MKPDYIYIYNIDRYKPTKVSKSIPGFETNISVMVSESEEMAQQDKGFIASKKDLVEYTDKLWQAFQEWQERKITRNAKTKEELVNLRKGQIEFQPQLI